MKKLLPNCARGSSYFIPIELFTLWMRKGYTSMFSPEYVSTLAGLPRRLSNPRRTSSRINPRLLILQRGKTDPSPITAQFPVQSVNASEGSERDIVLLSTCRPRGHLGRDFVTDRQRHCVAVSCTEAGLVIFGHQTMGDRGPSREFQSWKRTVDHFKARNRLHVLPGSRRVLENRLRIPNDEDYAPLTKQ